jgi:hypothetical protein
MRKLVLLPALFVLAWLVPAHAFLFLRAAGGYSVGQTIASVNLSGDTFTGGSGAGTVVGAITVTMSPSTPASAASLSITGADASDFQLAGSGCSNVSLGTCDLELATTLAAGSYSINVVATQDGISNSPYTQPETITGTSPGSEVTLVQKDTPATCAGVTYTCTATVTVQHPGDMILLGVSNCNGSGTCGTNYSTPGAVTSISDSQDNTCRIVPGSIVGLTNQYVGDPELTVGYCQDLASSGSDTITLTFNSASAGATYIWISPVELGGAALNNPVEGIGGFVVDFTGNGYPPATTGAYTKATQSGDFVYSLVAGYNVTPAATVTALNTGSESTPYGTVDSADQYSIASAAGYQPNTWDTPGGGEYSGATTAAVAIIPATSPQFQSVNFIGKYDFEPNSPNGLPIAQIESTVIPSGQYATYSLQNGGTDHSGTSCASTNTADFQVASGMLEVNSASLAAGSYPGVCVVASDGPVSYVQAFTLTAENYPWTPNTLTISNQSGAAANGSYSYFPVQFGRAFVDGAYPGANGINEATQCPAMTAYASVGTATTAGSMIFGSIAGNTLTTTSGTPSVGYYVVDAYGQVAAGTEITGGSGSTWTVSGASQNTPVEPMWVVPSEGTTVTLTGDAPASGTYYVAQDSMRQLAGIVTATISTTSATATLSTNQYLPAGDVLTFYDESGTAVTSQTDVKNSYPDGDMEFAVISAMVPTSFLPTSGAKSLLWITAGASPCTNTPVTLASMLSSTYNTDLQFNMVTSGTQTIDARTMLTDAENGSGCGSMWTVSYLCRYWTEGSVATEVLLTDDSQTKGDFDIGTGDGNTPFRPRIYATFWPETGQTSYRFVGEDDLMNYTEDLQYDFNICLGYPTCTQAFPASGNYNLDPGSASGVPLMKGQTTFTVDDDTSRILGDNPMWTGGAPTNEIDLDPNARYWEDTKFLPHYDLTLVMDPTSIADYYGAVEASNPSGNSGPGPYALGYPWLVTAGSMEVGGAHDYLGLHMAQDVEWLMSGDWRMRVTALTAADQAEEWPMESLENRTGMPLRRGDTGSTGLGYPASITANPNCGDVWACPAATGSLAGNPTWVPDNEHVPEPFGIPYLLTGDPHYLDDMEEWNVSYTINAPVSPYSRIPDGTFGNVGDQLIRQMAWYARDHALAAFLAPDSDPMKAVATDWFNDNMAEWDGEKRLPTPEYSTPSAGGSYQAYMAGASLGSQELCVPYGTPYTQTSPMADGNCVNSPLGQLDTNYKYDGATAWQFYTVFSSATQPQGDDGGTFMMPYMTDTNLLAQRLGFDAYQQANYTNQAYWGPIENLNLADAEAILTPFHTPGYFVGGGLNGYESNQTWAQALSGFDWKYPTNETGTFTASQSGATLTVTSIPSDQPLNLNNWLTCSGCTQESITAWPTGGGGVGNYTVSVSQNISSTTFTQQFNGVFNAQPPTVPNSGGPAPQQTGNTCYGTVSNCAGPANWSSNLGANAYVSEGWPGVSEMFDNNMQYGQDSWNFYMTNAWASPDNGYPSVFTSCTPGCAEGGDDPFSGPLWAVTPNLLDPVILPKFTTTSPTG